MSSNIHRAPADFIRLKEIDRREDRYDEHVNTLFEENGLYRKRLIKGPSSLMRAISDTLYFTTNQHKEIQVSLISFLTQLIASDKLTHRLSNFQGNSMLLKDFASNPQLPGFEKINLELVSLYFKVRIILYTMNEDHYLTATIFNNNYPNTIELLRTKNNHYDAIYSKDFMSKAGMCQNIVLNIIDNVINGRSSPTKNINEDEYVNFIYESSLVDANKETSLEQFRVTRGQHKKSLSDNFNTNFETMQEQQNKFYDAFMNAAPSDEFIKNFKNRKETAESGFSINANFDFIDEQNLEVRPQGQEFAIKNYPIPSNGLSPRNQAMELDSPMPVFSKAKFSSHSNVLFNENLSLAEIERLEKTVNTATTQGEPKHMGQSPFYRSVSPPGLSPTKFSQRSFTEAIQTPQSHSDFLSPSPIIGRGDSNMQINSPVYPYGNNSPNKRGISTFMPQSFQAMNNEKPLFNPQPMGHSRQYPDNQIQAFAPQAQQLNSQSQSFSIHPQQLNNMYMKRPNNIVSPMSIPSQLSSNDEYHMGPQSMGYDHGMQYDQFDQSPTFDNSPGYDGMDYDQTMFGQQGYNGMPREKKKPIILDESNERYYGRLKFFDENKKYGFIVMDDDGSDIFVHYDDLIKAGINKDLLRTAKMGNLIRMSFSCMAYIGKYNRSRKATDIQII